MDITSWIFEGVGDALEKAGMEMAFEISEEISTPYPPASVPGEPPHLRTGTLRDSVGYSVVTTSDTQMQLIVGAGPAISPQGVEYAYIVEKILDRPYVLNKAEKTAELFIQHLLNND